MESDPTKLYSVEQKQPQPRKLRFVDICAKHHLDIVDIAREGRVPEHVVYFLCIRKPVEYWEADDALEGVFQLSKASYEVDDLDIPLLSEEDEEGSARSRNALCSPYHRVSLGDKIVYEGFDWEEAKKQFYHALSMSGGKRIVSHVIEAPRVPRPHMAGGKRPRAEHGDA
jgi:hypothetical protein